MCVIYFDLVFVCRHTLPGIVLTYKLNTDSKPFLRQTMPVSRRSAVTVRSSRAEVDDEVLPAVSRVVRTTIRLGRKPSRRQRFVKETDPILPTLRPVVAASSTNLGSWPTDNDDHSSDADAINNFPHNALDDHFEPDDFDALESNDGSGDASDDDILPSFGPQLSLAEDIESNDDVVDFARLNKEYYNKNVRPIHYPSLNKLRAEQDSILKQWTTIRNTVLDEIQRHDGFVVEDSYCSRVGCENVMSLSSSFRCLDCLPDAHKCISCMVKVHSLLPFHRIEVSTNL